MAIPSKSTGKIDQALIAIIRAVHQQRLLPTGISGGTGEAGTTYEFRHNINPLKLDWSSIRYRFKGCSEGKTYCTTISEFDLDDILTTSFYIKRYRELVPSGESRVNSERREYGAAVAIKQKWHYAGCRLSRQQQLNPDPCVYIQR